MALRTFKDPAGVEWQVWDVAPYGQKAPDRRKADRRGSSTQRYTGPERRKLPDRRRDPDRRSRARTIPAPGVEQGWLCFDSGADKRRLSPVPPGWEAFPEDKLYLLHRMAQAKLQARKG